MTLRLLFETLLGRKLMYKIRYFHQRKRWPCLNHPQDLSEILISRILNDDFIKFAPYADKIQVREYVKSKGLNHILLQHYHYWDNANDIKKEELPDQFVLKTNNGASGKDIFICRDKSKFDLEKAKKQLFLAQKKIYKYEKQYNEIKSRVLCEQLIDTGSDSWPVDYKFTCIHGKPVDIFVGSQREKGVKFCTRNLDWSELKNTRQSYLPDVIPPKPKHLEEMIEISKKLSEDFDFVRVDLYEYNDQVYFGELTFSPWGGIMYSYTDEAIKEYGKLLLNKEKND